MPGELCAGIWLRTVKEKVIAVWAGITMSDSEDKMLTVNTPAWSQLACLSSIPVIPVKEAVSVPGVVSVPLSPVSEIVGEQDA